MIKKFRPLLPACLAICVASGPAAADPPVITDVAVTAADMGWRFAVTLRHPDTGWDHFADAWDIMTPDGTVIATRRLKHPHVDEQPFTRSLVNVLVPDGMRVVMVRARCSHGDYSEPVLVKLPR